MMMIKLIQITITKNLKKSGKFRKSGNKKRKSIPVIIKMARMIKMLIIKMLLIKRIKPLDL